MSFTSERKVLEKKSNLLNKLLHFVGKKLKRLSNKRSNSFWTKINVPADFDDMCLSKGLLIISEYQAFLFSTAFNNYAN